jgi:hypothetical protein
LIYNDINWLFNKTPLNLLVFFRSTLFCRIDWTHIQSNAFNEQRISPVHRVHLSPYF